MRPKTRQLSPKTLLCLAALSIARAQSSSAADELASSLDSRTSSFPAAPFVRQPLLSRATFRPLIRASSSINVEQPVAPRASRQQPRPVALSLSERSISNESPFSDNSFFAPPLTSRTGNNNPESPFSSATFIQPVTSFETSTTSRLATEAPPTLTTTISDAATTTSLAAAFTTAAGTLAPPPTTIGFVSTMPPPAHLDEDEQPTRQPLARFRPTRAPTGVEDPPPTGSGAATNLAADQQAASNSSSDGRMSQECFECICEASTSCNAQSRCQTSDVRHTRCGLFLISYDQWLATGLSRELVSREALSSDAAADERAFYDCVTQRDCAQRLLAIYMARHRKDCNKDGRVDCYDLAAIHHSGMEQCASEALLDSQYWRDFNACLGFGRRRRR